MINKARKLAADILPQITELRHLLHSQPEVGVDTPGTTAKIRAALANTPIQLNDPLVGSEIIGELKGRSNRTILLRADIDAVPLQETNDLPYRSQNDGKMHACGHDGHASMLVGAALVLGQMQNDLPVSIRFVFQPGEEMCAAGRTLVERGVADGCEAAFALHGWPGYPTGAIVAKEGPMFAAGTDFTIRVIGKECHGAMPHLGNNPIPPLARIITELEHLHTRLNQESGTVVSVCTIQAGNTGNIIPGTATAIGTARYLDPKYGDIVIDTLTKTARSIEDEYHIQIELELEQNYSLPTINSKTGYTTAKNLVTNHLPGIQWIDAPEPTMAMEDFAFYLDKAPGAILWLGMGEKSPGLHTPHYNFNDTALQNGITVMSCLPFVWGKEE